MEARPGLPDDTSAKAQGVWLSLMRKQSIGQRLEAAMELSDLVYSAQEAGERMRLPCATERDIFLRIAAERLGPELMNRVYGAARGAGA